MARVDWISEANEIREIFPWISEEKVISVLQTLKYPQVKNAIKIYWEDAKKSYRLKEINFKTLNNIEKKINKKFNTKYL